MAFDGARLWVACRDGNTVHVLRMSNGQPLFTVAVGTNPNGGLLMDGTSGWSTRAATM